jgi:flagellar motor switch/type III secretory pathway protein FliN
MKPAALRWVPQSVCTRFQTDVDQALARWAQAWNLTATVEAGAVRLTEPADWRGVSEPDWLAADTGWGPWIALPATLQAQLVGSLFPGDAAGSSVAPAVAKRAEAQLVDILMALLRAPSGAAPPLQPEPALGHAGIRYHAPLLGTHITILATTAWLEARGWLQRPAAHTPLAASALEAALAPLPVSMTLEVGTAALSIGDLHGIAPGDVVLSATAMTMPLRLRVNGGDQALPVFLGRSGAQRAVQMPVSPKKHVVNGTKSS